MIEQSYGIDVILPMILQIGNHQFDIDLSYETLERAASWEWGEVPIVGDYPILQNVRKEGTDSHVHRSVV